MPFRCRRIVQNTEPSLSGVSMCLAPCRVLCWLVLCTGFLGGAASKHCAPPTTTTVVYLHPKTPKCRASGG